MLNTYFVDLKKDNLDTGEQLHIIPFNISVGFYLSSFEVSVKDRKRLITKKKLFKYTYLITR